MITFAIGSQRMNAVAYPGILFRGGSKNSAEGRENGDLGLVAP